MSIGLGYLLHKKDCSYLCANRIQIMNFRDLEYAIESAKALSFSHAAKICNVSQPSLSAQIKKLEKELGLDIFIRSKRRIHLTAFGETFVQKAQEILSIRGDIRGLANKNQNPLEGKIKLGAILTVAPYLFPQIVNEVQKKAPKMKLFLKEAKTEELLSLLLSGKIDAAIVSLPIDENVFETQTLFTEPFYVAVSEKHTLAKRKSIKLDKLNDYSLILLEEGHCFRNQALDVCRSASAKESEIFTATSLETIRYFVATSNRVTLMPAMAKRKNDGIRYLPLKNKKFMREIGIIWRKTCVKKAPIEKLIRFIGNISMPQ